jgi:hypothetical protein
MRRIFHRHWGTLFLSGNPSNQRQKVAILEPKMIRQLARTPNPDFSHYQQTGGGSTRQSGGWI